MTAVFNFERPDRDHIAQLAAFSCATIHEANGQRGALPHFLKPISRDMRLHGTIMTVCCPAGDNLALHRAIEGASAGDVLVVDHEGSLDDGPFGDIMAEACLVKGIAGLVIDGCIRDAATIRRMNFPVFCRGLCIRGTTKIHAGRIGHPIRLGQHVVESGGVILGDEDGLVVVARCEVPEAIEKCAHREQTETGLRQAIRSGMSTIDLLNLKRELP
ncbi:MAG: 4-carboxy-4-hydroxy-2-oxoadipate aldolase/oxaloacetate decarboxylase [Phyllobacterium sp.]